MPVNNKNFVKLWWTKQNMCWILLKARQSVISDGGELGQDGEGGSTGLGVSYSGSENWLCLWLSRLLFRRHLKVKKQFSRQLGWHPPPPGCVHSRLYKKWSFLLSSSRMPSIWGPPHPQSIPLAFKVVWVVEHLEISISFVKCHEILTYLIFIIQTQNDFSNRKYGRIICTQVSAT